MRDVWSAAALLALGGAILLAGRDLPLGRVGAPGPGFFPTVLAVALVLVATALLGSAWRRRAAVPAAAPPPAAGVRRVSIVAAAMTAYALVLEPVGFVGATFVLLLVLFRAVQSQRWPLALGGSAAATALSHLLFKTWLGVRLPPGPWGF